MTSPSIAAVREARRTLAQWLPITRLVPAPSLSRLSGVNVFLKLEGDLPTGSFKPRGALWALDARLRRGPIAGVVTCSTGNHGAAVACAARQLGVPAFVFLPENPNPVKRANIAGLGAAIFESGRDLAVAFRAASEYAESRDFYFLNDATDHDLPAGPATIACEILEQLESVDVIYVPMGDTALIRGVASAAKEISPRIRIIGVQAELAPAYYLSWRQGIAVSTETCDTIADGLATRTPDSANVDAIRQLVDDIVLVTEQQMLAAIRHLIVEEHVVAEPSGAATTAALLAIPNPRARNIVLIVSGANVSLDVLRLAIRAQ